MSDEPVFEGIVAKNPAMREVVKRARVYANTDIPVTLVGEDGTEKEELARAMHFASARRDRPFMAVKCAVFPEPLLEVELFGQGDQAGLFEQADGGSLFLDDVAEASLAVQCARPRVACGT